MRLKPFGKSGNRNLAVSPAFALAAAKALAKLRGQKT